MNIGQRFKTCFSLVHQRSKKLFLDKIVTVDEKWIELEVSKYFFLFASRNKRYIYKNNSKFKKNVIYGQDSHG